MPQILQHFDVVQARIYCQDNEQTSVNSLHFVVTTVSPTATLADAAARVDNDLGPLFKGIINNRARYLGVQCQIVNRVPLNTSEENTLHAGAGTAGVDALPRQTCGLTTWRTIIAGPGGRGRSYWPFPSVSDDTGDGVPTAGYNTRIVALENQVFAILDFNAGGRLANCVPVLFKRKVPRTSSVWEILTEGKGAQLWATQRRRGSYGRPNNPPI